MHQYCYTLAVRQRTCENGISKRIDNVYTNVTNNTVIPLSFGYEITFISSTNRNATIQISNRDKIPNIILNIPAGGYKIFDLPIDNGSLRVFISATSIDCDETVICCRIS